MPGWSRRLRIMIDWTFALLFRPDIVKISLDSEAALLLREAVAEGMGGKTLDEGAARTGAGDGTYQHARGGAV
jgi:hypothetical protein